ncbi:MAG: nuoA [Acidimicrobiia bacterium]|nr:nuoA [Acidimicrobiia bacterium]
MGQYLPLLVLMVLGFLFAAVSFVASRLLAPKRPTAAKEAPYECGIVPSRDAPERFPVSFYLVAMLFIMFDIEIVFLYPYAVDHEELGLFGFWSIMLFSVVFFLSFVYEVGKGGLDWGPLNQMRRLSTVRSDALTASDRTSTSTIRRVGLEGREEPGEAA